MRLPVLTSRKHHDVLLRALRLRVRNHLTTRCACEFCETWRHYRGNESPEYRRKDAA